MSKGKGFIIGATVASILMMGVGVGLEQSADASGIDQYKDVTGHEDTEASASSATTVATSETENANSASDESSEVIQQASAEDSAEENGVEYLKLDEYTLHPLRAQQDSDDVVVWRDNKYAATFYTRYTMLDQVASFKEKGIDRIEKGNRYEAYLISSEGKHYVLSEYSEGFQELPEGSVNPALSGSDITYVMPTSSDKAVGDLYYMYAIYDIPKLVASDVVAQSNGVIRDWTGLHFIYEKYVNGQYSITRASVDRDAINQKEGDYQVEETTLVEGNYMPIGYVENTSESSYSLYYFDCVNKDIYFKDSEKTRKILSGGFDKYYYGGMDLIIVSGDDVYYFSPGLNVDVAVPVLHTGLSEYYTGGYCSPLGYNNGYRIDEEGVLIDNDGKEYILKENGNDGNPITAYELPHKLEEKGVELYSNHLLSYIEDGVLYVDEIRTYDVRKYILFDKEPVYSTCVCPDGDDFFVFTTTGNIYYIDFDEQTTTMIDSGIDFIEETQDYNYTWDYKWDDLVYSKNGKFYYFDIYTKQVEDGFDEDVEGYFIHEGDYTFFQYPDEDSSRLYSGHNFYPFY